MALRSPMVMRSSDGVFHRGRVFYDDGFLVDDGAINMLYFSSYLEAPS